MRNLLCAILLTCFLTYAMVSCEKDKNYYAIADYTVGMVNSRTWNGYAYGNTYGDTVIAPDTLVWPKRFYRNITDTVFAPLKINNFVLNVDGTWLVFRSVDSVKKLIRYDSSYANHSAVSFLEFDYGKDTMHFEVHQNLEFNVRAGKYYEINKVLRSTR